VDGARSVREAERRDSELPVLAVGSPTHPTDNTATNVNVSSLVKVLESCAAALVFPEVTFVTSPHRFEKYPTPG
jgi:hypothetical protein